MHDSEKYSVGCPYKLMKSDPDSDMIYSVWSNRSKPKLFLFNLMMSLLLAAVSKEIDYKFQCQPEFLLWMFERQPRFCLSYYKKNF